MEDLVKYSETEIVRYNDLTQALDITDPGTVLRFGADFRGVAENVADELLRATRRKEAGEIGESLAGLLAKIEDIELKDPAPAPSWKKTLMRVLPFSKPFLDSFQKFQTRYDTVADTFERIKEDVGRIREETIVGNNSLATMYTQTLQYRDLLGDLIKAGYYKLQEIKDEKDQRIMSFRSALENDLKTKEAQYHLLDNTLANILIMAQDAQWVCQKADRIVSIVIPNMKNQANMAIRAMKLRYYANVFEGIDETANKLITQTSQAVKDASIKLAEQITKEDIELDVVLQAVKTTYSTVEELSRILRENNSKSRVKIDELARETKRLKESLNQKCISVTKV